MIDHNKLQAFASGERHIPVFKPLLEAEERQAALDVLALGWLGMGSYVGQFEQALSDYLGCTDRHVVAVSTGHAALHLGLMIAGVQEGDEVITASFNNIADFQAILAVGATPVFCDIDPVTLCMDASKIEELITPRTRAIIPMDYGCQLADHATIAQIAEKHGLRIIHDAAHSIGSRYHSKNIGTFSDICMFSFDPVKTATCIDGGALVVRTKQDVEMLHEMRLVGMNQAATQMYKNQRAWTYDVRTLGYRYHMANMHAAIGFAQVKKMERISSMRKERFNLYQESLANIPCIIRPTGSEHDITPFLYPIRVSKGLRNDFREFLRGRGIDTGIHWQPGHTFSLFKNYPHGDLTVTNQISQEVVSLPFHTALPLEDISYIAHIIKRFVNEHA